MRIIEELKNSDLFNLFKTESFIDNIGVFNFEMPLNSEQIEKLETILNIKKIKKNEKVQNCKLKDIKNYKDEIENWIYNHLNYPITSLNVYQEMLNTLKQGEKDEIELIILTFPQHIEKVLQYEKNKGSYFVDNELLKSFIQNLKLTNDYNFYSQKENPTNINKNEQQIEKFEVTEKSKENKKINFNELKNGNKENTNKSSKTLSTQENKIDIKKIEKNLKDNEEKEVSNALYLGYKKTIDQLYTKFILETNYENLSQEEREPLRKGFVNKINEANSFIALKNNLEELDIFKNLILPILLEEKDENKLKLLSDIWVRSNSDRIVVDENLLSGMFWKNINTLKDEPSKKELIYDFLSKNIKQPDYDKEKFFKMVFESLVLITKDEDKFKERLEFFEKLNFSITKTELLAKLYEQDGRIKVDVAQPFSLSSTANYEIANVGNLLIKSVDLLKNKNPETANNALKIWSKAIEERKEKAIRSISRKRTI